MRTVKDVLGRKKNPRAVRSIRPDETVFAALGQMAEHNVGALLVLDGEQVVGILSERDYARKVILQGKASKDLPVREIMSARVLAIAPERSAEEAMALMTSKGVRHLPVMKGGDLLGVISIGDAVAAVIADREFVIEQLEYYINIGT